MYINTDIANIGQINKLFINGKKVLFYQQALDYCIEKAEKHLENEQTIDKLENVIEALATEAIQTEQWSTKFCNNLMHFYTNIKEDAEKTFNIYQTIKNAERKLINKNEQFPQIISISGENSVLKNRIINKERISADSYFELIDLYMDKANFNSDNYQKIIEIAEDAICTKIVQQRPQILTRLMFTYAITQNYDRLYEIKNMVNQYKRDEYYYRAIILYHLSKLQDKNIEEITIKINNIVKEAITKYIIKSEEFFETLLYTYYKKLNKFDEATKISDFLLNETHVNLNGNIANLLALIYFKASENPNLSKTTRKNYIRNAKDFAKIAIVENNADAYLYKKLIQQYKVEKNHFRVEYYTKIAVDRNKINKDDEILKALKNTNKDIDRNEIKHLILLFKNH